METFWRVLNIHSLDWELWQLRGEKPGTPELLPWWLQCQSDDGQGWFDGLSPMATKKGAILQNNTLRPILENICWNHLQESYFTCFRLSIQQISNNPQTFRKNKTILFSIKPARELPWSFICLFPSFNNRSSMGMEGSTLATDTKLDSHKMLKELKLSNFLPCWSNAANSRMGFR